MAEGTTLQIDTKSASRFFNRELSWLAFNRRVLSEASNIDYPLLERLRFLSISGSNLDEFLMVRVAGLAGQLRRQIQEISQDGLTAPQQLAAIRVAVDELQDEQQTIWSTLQDEMATCGIAMIETQQASREVKRWLKSYFKEHLLPLITPQAIDPAHPFPFVGNQGMGVLLNLKRRADGAKVNEMVLLPPMLPRFVRMPGTKAVYISLENMLLFNAPLLFPGFKISGHGVFRILRDSDIEIEEDAEDLVRHFRTAIQRRRRGKVVVLQLQGQFDPAFELMLRKQLRLDQHALVTNSRTIGVSGLSAIIEEDRPDLKFEPFAPRYPERILEKNGDCFAAIREKDIVIHHPYESFEVVVDFLRQAAADPDVVAIKQTLYRAGKQSAVIAALIAAAEAGKSVTAVVELKARFEEEQNIWWADQLERAGVQVLYGFLDWKTHAKVSMVVRHEGGSYRTYCHFGTGNYHPVTARIYTDLSFFTADPKAGRDAGRLFNFITGYVEPRGTELLAISPLTLRSRIYSCIDREIANATAGKPAEIWAKMNSLTDGDLIDHLYAASTAGVSVRLVIRGICCLRPGVPGLSENIVVKSIIGRFLEHSRIWAFANGGKLPNRRAQLFITSADGMTRNLDRRVETMIPIRNATVHDQVLSQVMLANLLDTERSWVLQPDGTYRRIGRSQKAFNLHDYFMTNPSLSGRGAALDSGRRVPKLALRRGAGG